MLVEKKPFGMVGTPVAPRGMGNGAPSPMLIMSNRKSAIIPRSILVLDVGGTSVKFLATGQSKPRKIASGNRLTPRRMIDRIRAMTDKWLYDAVAIGFPGQVDASGPRSEPPNLGTGWLGFDFAGAFGHPVKIINDAAMQALGSYEGGRMLFLGLGTGLGTALIADKTIVPLELGELRSHNGSKFCDCLGLKGLHGLGIVKWRRAVRHAVEVLNAAFLPDYVMLGGGNARRIDIPPPNARLGNNNNAFRGGFRLWNLDELPTVAANESMPVALANDAPWRIL